MDGTLIDAGYLKMMVTPEVLDNGLDDYPLVAVYAPGATEIRVSDGYDVYSAKGEFYCDMLYDYVQGQPITASALIDGTWHGPCAPATVKRNNYGVLDAPVVTVPERCLAYRPFTVSCTTDERFFEYSWWIYTLDTNERIAWKIDEKPYTTFYGLPAGRYRIVVEPNAGIVAWDCKRGSAEFTVVEAASDDRVQLSANTTYIEGTSNWENRDPVELTVTAAGADAYRLYSTYGDEWEQASSNVFEDELHGEQTITYFAYARIRGEWCGPSAPVTVQWVYKAVSAETVITVPEGYTAYRPFTVSWTPMEGAEYYYYYLRGLGILMEGFVWDGSGSTSVDVGGLPEGVYQVEVEVCNARDEIIDIGMEQFTIAAAKTDPRVRLTAITPEVQKGSKAILSGSAPGATDYRLYTVLSKSPIEQSSTGASCELTTKRMYETNTFYLYAKIGGVWCGPSEPVTVRVKFIPNLEEPIVTVPSLCAANTPVKIAWNAVPNAQKYTWSIYKANFKVREGTASAGENSVTIEGLLSGEYEFSVEAFADGYNSRWSHARFTVASTASDPRVRLSAPASVPVGSRRVTMTVTAEGAEAYSIRRNDSWYSEAEGTNATLSVYYSGPGEYVAYAKIDGEWWGPSEPVTVLLTPDVVLPSALKEIGAEAFMGAKFTAVQCPKGLKRIDIRAFAGCEYLHQIEIPASVTEIAKTAFAGCYNVTLCGEEGSYAQRWAEENGFYWVTIP